MLPNQTLTAVFGGIRFFVHPEALGIVPGVKLPKRMIQPAVLFSLPDADLNDETIAARLSAFSEVDDVYSSAFDDILLLQSFRKSPSQALISGLNQNRRFGSVYTFVVQSQDKLLAAGPYFVAEDGIHQAWRLYPDTLGAFVTTVVPDTAQQPKRYSVLQAVSEDGLYKSVAVPSRLYASPSKEQPLAGVRLNLKDNINLAGIHTTLMNRAYADLYPPATKSAAYAEKLAAFGAVIVGKTKLCAFASEHEPTDLWIDYHCPFNPRSDFYQSPSESTSGGGASLAGYPWLDYSIGTDTGGSILSPAAYNGLFSLRTSWQSAPMDGIIESCRLFDTVGILSRTVDGIHRMAKATLNVSDSQEFPKKILYPVDFFPQVDWPQQQITDSFVAILEKYLGVKKTEIYLAKRWEESPPQEANLKSMSEYLFTSSAWPLYYYTYHAFNEFREEYKKVFEKEVYVGPNMQRKWDYGKKVSADVKDQGVVQLDVFRKWFNHNVMSETSTLLSNAVMVMPFGNDSPYYRDETALAPAPGPGSGPTAAWTLNPFFLAPVLQLPEIIIPVGQKRYSSRASGNDEYLPIVIGLVGAKGSDLMLANLAKAALEASSWPTEVKTGRNMFELGNNNRNVAPR